MNTIRVPENCPALIKYKTLQLQNTINEMMKIKVTSLDEWYELLKLTSSALALGLDICEWCSKRNTLSSSFTRKDVSRYFSFNARRVFRLKENLRSSK